LFSTASTTCKRCRRTHTQILAANDLDGDYETVARAMASFLPVATAAGLKMLYDHAKEYYDETIHTQGVIRDKAKALFGATSFTITVISASVALVKDTINDITTSWFIALLFLFGVIVAHFIRALVLAIQTITREETCAVSTQDIVTSLDARQAEYDSGAVYLRLAARYRSAATHMHQLLTDRKESLILAQTSFKWGLIWLPLFFGLYIAYVFFIGSQTPQWAVDLKSAVAAVERDQQELQKQVELRDSSLEATVSKIQDAARVDPTRQQQSDDLHIRTEGELRKGLDLAGVDVKRLSLSLDGLASRMENVQRDTAQVLTLQQELADAVSRLREVELQLRTLTTKMDAAQHVGPSSK